MYIFLVILGSIGLQIPVMCMCSGGLKPVEADVHLKQLTEPDVTIRYHQQDQANTTTRNQSQPLIESQEQRQQQARDENFQIDLRSFRLEYNKYKILSQLGITVNPEEIYPQLSDEMRTHLTAATTSKRNIDKEPLVGSARQKRSLACDQVNSNKNTCCRENFYVNFTHIGWDKWILYPAGYNANYCRGQCDLSHARYYHSTLLSKYNNVVNLCCSPKQMAPLRLLYIDEENKVLEKSIPDMIVETCDCA